MTELTAPRVDYNLTTKTNSYNLTAHATDYRLTTMYDAVATVNAGTLPVIPEQSGLLLRETQSEILLSGVSTTAYTELGSGVDLILKFGQPFLAVTGGNAWKATANLKKTGSPTGNATFQLYPYNNSTGVVGSLLATSSNLDVSTLTTSKASYSVYFPSGQNYKLENNVWYFIALCYSGGDVDNNVGLYQVGISPCVAQKILYGSTDWTPSSIFKPDINFYSSGERIEYILLESGDKIILDGTR